ncbi:MAG: hypothetical protein Q8Q31_01360 [Nanoarchaeota archaeon]|nr:hypothetical protein [Nanoarchaeota archaeon]
MNKRGTIGDLPDTVITVILIVLFAAFLFVFVGQQKNGAGVWEDVYAKEIAQIINLAEPGDEISIDIHYATEIAKKNRYGQLDSIIKFDNENREVIVKLRSRGETRFSYYNNVEIVNDRIELGVPVNILKFRIVESEKEEMGEGENEVIQ